VKFLIVLSVVAFVAALMRVCVHFGYRYIDKMLCVSPPVDPNKPIVLPSNGER
jgi:hypothetical protein